MLTSLTESQPLPDPYKQLQYDSMRVVRREAIEQITITTRGTRAVIGTNASKITTTYTGSSVKSMKPKNALFACFLVSRTSFVPSVTCDIEVTAFDPSNAEYSAKTICSYDGGGDVQSCPFDASWTEVAKLEFQILPTGFLGSVANVLGFLLSLTGVSNIADVGTTAFFLDDFSTVYNCEHGFENDAAGLCV